MNGGRNSLLLMVGAIILVLYFLFQSQSKTRGMVGYRPTGRVPCRGQQAGFLAALSRLFGKPKGGGGGGAKPPSGGGGGSGAGMAAGQKSCCKPPCAQPLCPCFCQAPGPQPGDPGFVGPVEGCCCANTGISCQPQCYQTCQPCCSAGACGGCAGAGCFCAGCGVCGGCGGCV